MSNLEDLEKGIQGLSAEELAGFRAWFVEFDHLVWDRQIDADPNSGKPDAIASEALADYRAGKARGI